MSVAHQTSQLFLFIPLFPFTVYLSVVPYFTAISMRCHLRVRGMAVVGAEERDAFSGGKKPQWVVNKLVMLAV